MKARGLFGLELVGISRVKDPSCLAIGNQSNTLSVAQLKKIGTSNNHKKIKEFRKNLEEKALLSQSDVIENIKNLDLCSDSDDASFEGGCEFLLNWYRETFSNNL